jgi:hypothetical protein
LPETYKRFYQGQPGTAAAQVYQAPAAPAFGSVMRQIRAVNMGTVTATVGVFHGGTAVGNRILPDVPLAPGEWLEDDLSAMMAPGDTLAAVASVANAITLTIYGVELS